MLRARQCHQALPLVDGQAESDESHPEPLHLRTSTAKVSLITLVTPVIALLLGSVLNGEAVSMRGWLGVA